MWNPYQGLLATHRRLLPVLGVGAVLVVWATVTGLDLVSKAALSSPKAVVEAFGRVAWDPAYGESPDALTSSPLLDDTLWSLMRVGIAGVLVVAVGVPIGILMGASPRINAVLSPLVDPFRSAPVVALLPIFVIWLGIDETMKIAFLFTGAIVYLIPMVRDAMVAVPQEHWVLARDLGATPFEAVRHSVLPMAKPRIADAIIVATSVMWTYITVAEFTNAREGLGAFITNARRFSAMDQVFVGIFMIIALALVTLAIMTGIKRRLYPWESET